MKLMTAELQRRFAELGCQDGKGMDAEVVARYFDPCGAWTWYATEYDPARQEFFGYVAGFEQEWGSFSLEEMEAIKGPFGIGLERDLSFREMSLRDALRRDRR